MLPKCWIRMLLSNDSSEQTQCNAINKFPCKGTYALALIVEIMYMHVKQRNQ